MKRLEKVPAKFRKDVSEKLRFLANSLQKRRKSLGLTQERFAEELGISEVTLRAIEGGRRFPSLPMLLYICNALGVQVEFKKIKR